MQTYLGYLELDINITCEFEGFSLRNTLVFCSR